MLQEEVKGLGQADEFATVHGEGGHLGPSQVHHPALIVLRDVLHWGWSGVDRLARQVGVGGTAAAAGTCAGGAGGGAGGVG